MTSRLLKPHQSVLGAGLLCETLPRHVPRRVTRKDDALDISVISRGEHFEVEMNGEKVTSEVERDGLLVNTSRFRKYEALRVASRAREAHGYPALAPLC